MQADELQWDNRISAPKIGYSRARAFALSSSGKMLSALKLNQ
ncbi:MAG: hypothetical protein OFPI_15220 [Osedax symbiont Rs2]|nr:MAG: hypothetical protein OFPII_40620 [Osedax symbiont Rs1]EPJ52153.1 MAG: hypothetical protein OFPI_15220 [Osedax symbiont Rs2]